MSETTTSKSGLFLMELILVILLFSVSAAICLQMFAFASLTVQDAENLSHATLAARSAADCYRVTEGNLEQSAVLLSGTAAENTLLIGYDGQWQPTDLQPQYVLVLSQQGTVASITVCEDGEEEPIYTLTTRIPGGDS